MTQFWLVYLINGRPHLCSRHSTLQLARKAFKRYTRFTFPGNHQIFQVTQRSQKGIM